MTYKKRYAVCKNGIPQTKWHKDKEVAVSDAITKGILPEVADLNFYHTGEIRVPGYELVEEKYR